MRLRSHRLVRVPKLTTVHHQKRAKLTMEQSQRFLLYHVDAWVWEHRLHGELMAPGCTMGSQWGQYDALGPRQCSAAKPRVLAFVLIVPKHCCRQSTPLQWQSYCLMEVASFSRTAKIVQEYDKKFMVLTWAPNSPGLSLNKQNSSSAL